MSTDYQTENDAFEFDAPADFKPSGGAYLDFGMDGTYHVEVTAIDRTPKKKDGTLIQNARLSASLIVLDGTNPNGVRKAYDLMFFNPDFSKGPEAVERENSKIGKFFAAVGLIDPNAPTRDASGNPIRMKIANPQAAVGRQFVIELESNEWNGRKSLRLAFDRCYHVDDPMVAGVPKDAAALANYPAQFRRKPESFMSGKPGSKASGSSSSPAKSATSQPTKSATAASQSQTVTADDL